MTERDSDHYFGLVLFSSADKGTTLLKAWEKSGQRTRPSYEFNSFAELEPCRLRYTGLLLLAWEMDVLWSRSGFAMGFYFVFQILWWL